MRWAQRGVLLGLALAALVGVWLGVATLQRSLYEKRFDALVRDLEELADLESQAGRMAALRQLAEQGEQRFLDAPAIQEMVARAWALAAQVAVTPAEQVALLRRADQAVRRAIALRPSWPYAWMLLARIQFMLDPRNPALALALHQVLDRGARGFTLQRQLLELRLAGEDRFDARLNGRLQESFRLGLRDHGQLLAKLAVRAGRVEWVCSDPLARVHLGAWCERFDRPVPPR